MEIPDQQPHYLLQAAKMGPLPASGFWKNQTKPWHLYLQPNWNPQEEGKKPCSDILVFCS